MRSLYGVVPLFALLIAAIWFAITAWNHIDGPDIPLYGWVAIGVGAFFSLLVGGGLMALLFYSSRKGYDERAAKNFNKYL